MWKISFRSKRTLHERLYPRLSGTTAFYWTVTKGGSYNHLALLHDYPFRSTRTLSTGNWSRGHIPAFHWHIFFPLPNARNCCILIRHGRCGGLHCIFMALGMAQVAPRHRSSCPRTISEQ
jgi:hypothetical protein